MDLLHRLWPRRGFTLPQFEPAPLEFDADAGEKRDELLVEGVATGIGTEPRVVQQVRPMRSAGELQSSIALHLGAARHSAPPLSPADELRNALTELRRSLA